MDLIAGELSDEALRGIGRVLTPRNRPQVPAGEEFRYDQTLRDIGLAGPLSSGSLECAPRPKTLVKMERHLKTAEVLVALDGDAVVCLAPPQEPAGGRLQGLTAVRVRAGESFVMETGAWHWIPYPAGSRTVRFLVVFRNATGDDDLHFVDLAEPRAVK
jgi:mannose-6-phosphate isomerase-like protein (cupin superfamily)